MFNTDYREVSCSFAGLDHDCDLSEMSFLSAFGRDMEILYSTTIIDLIGNTAKKHDISSEKAEKIYQILLNTIKNPEVADDDQALITSFLRFATEARSAIEKKLNSEKKTNYRFSFISQNGLSLISSDFIDSLENLQGLGKNSAYKTTLKQVKADFTREVIAIKALLIEAEKKELEEQIQDLEEQKQSIEKTMQTAIDSAKESHRVEIEAKTAEAEKNNKEAQLKIEELEDALTKKRSEYTSAQDNHQKAVKEINDAHAKEVETLRAESVAAANKSQATIAKLEKDLGSARSELGASKDALKELAANVQSATGINEQQNLLIDAKTSEIQNLEEKVASLETSLKEASDAAEESNKAHADEIAALKKTHENYIKTLSATNEQAIADADTAHAESMDKLKSDLETAKQDAKAAQEKHASEIESIKSKHSANILEITSGHDQKAAQVEQQIQELNNNAGALQEEINKLQRNVADLEESNQKLSAENAQIATQRDKAETKAQKAIESAEKASSEASAAKTLAETAQAAEKAAQEALAQETLARKQAEQKVITAENTVTTTRNLLSNGEQELSNLVAENGRLKAENAAQATLIAELRAQILELTQAKETAETAAKEATSRAEEAEAKLGKCTNILDKARPTIAKNAFTKYASSQRKYIRENYEDFGEDVPEEELEKLTNTEEILSLPASEQAQFLTEEFIPQKFIDQASNQALGSSYSTLSLAGGSSQRQLAS